MNLLELVIVILIIGVVGSMVALPMLTGIDLWQMMSLRDNDLWEGRTGLHRMRREMASVQDDRSVITANSTTFIFTTGFAGNEEITFQYDSAYQQVKRNSDVLMENVTAFSFTYYDVHNNTLAAPIVGSEDDTDIWRIRIQVTLTSGGREFTMRQMVRPRSFLRENK